MLFALSLLTVGATQSIDSKALDDYFNKQIAEKKAPSVSVAVVRNGNVVYAKGFGYSDLENDIRPTPQTVYRLGSITKQFTATMIMQLVGAGKLKLDQPLLEILPEMPKAWSKVTVRNLLNHTSGIKSYTELDGLFGDQALKPITPAGIMKTVENSPMDFDPGTDWHYDNSGYELLGMIIEKLDGRRYEASLKARILEPLGMTSTYFTSERTLVKHRAQGYEWNGKGFLHAAYLNMDWPYAAGSMESTTLDLAKWDAALYGEKILPQSALKQMWTPTTLTGGKKEPYGFGWGIESLNGIQEIGHGGGIHGFTTYIGRVISKGLTIIVLTNSTGGPSQEMANTALGLVDKSLKVEPLKPIADRALSETSKARAILQAILDGSFDQVHMTPEFSKLITPQLGKVRESLNSFGKIESFQLLSDETKEGSRVRIYEVMLGKTKLQFTVSMNKDRLINALGIKG